MEITTFEDDLLGLSEFSHRIEKFIEVEKGFVQGGLVLGLSSRFGSGKSTFLKMWIASLESDAENKERPLPVLLNAWESDYLGDPLFAIISALASRFEKDGQSAGKLLEAAKDFGWFATAIGNQIAKKATGVDAIAAGDLAQKKKSERTVPKDLFPDSFTIYEGRKRAMGELRSIISDLVSDSEQTIVLLVDELDRCRPDYAISYLETIKHIFDIHGLIFIIAADRNQLENSAKTAFGAELDFEEYYRKFIHRETYLPQPTENQYKGLATAYIAHYLEREESRLCFMKFDYHRIENAGELLQVLKLTPRQIQEVFRILGHILETDSENQGKLRWCLGVGTLLMASLKVGAPTVFHALGTAKLAPEDALKFLSAIEEERTREWWFLICLTGGGLKLEEGRGMEAVLKELGLIPQGETSFRGLGQFSEGWGFGHQNRIPQIYRMIEELSKWK